MKQNLLIVDDQKDVCLALSRYFQITQGFDVSYACELEEAEALISENSYSMVITDLHLTPIRGNEGLEIVRLLRHQSPDTKIIMLTAYGTPDVERESLGCGASVILNKPLTLSSLTTVMREILGR